MSTRPGHAPIPPEEELARVLPVVEALAGRINIPISVDTYRATVARACLEAGAGIINDVGGLLFDSEMAQVVAELQARWWLCTTACLTGHLKVTEIS